MIIIRLCVARTPVLGPYGCAMAGKIGAAVRRPSEGTWLAPSPATTHWPPSPSIGGGPPRRCWACTLVVMDSVAAAPPPPLREGAKESAGATPETTRRVVSAAMQLRVAETGKDAEIHLLVLDPAHVPSQVPVGVTKVLHWKAETKGAAPAEKSGTDASTLTPAVAEAAADAIEHAFLSRADATHILATYGQFGGTALSHVARSLNARLHENVVEIQGRGSFVEHGAGLVSDASTRRLLTISSSHFDPADLRDAASVPVEVLAPPSRASKLLWKVVPAGMAIAVLLCAI